MEAMKAVMRESSANTLNSLNSAITSLESYENSRLPLHPRSYPDDSEKNPADDAVKTSKADDEYNSPSTTSSDTSTIGDLTSLLSQYREALVESFATTVEEDKAYDSSLRKQSERYEFALVEQSTLKEELEVEQQRHKGIVTKLESELSLMMEEFAAAKKEHEERQHAMDQLQQAKLSSAISRHNQKLECFSKKQSELESSLSESKQKHNSMQEALNATLQGLQETLSNEEVEHSVQVQNMDAQINASKQKLEAETKERGRLQAHFDLMDENDRIKREEEKIIQHVCSMEERAENMLHLGAIQLQRLFRGRRERIAFSGRMKKSKKKGKGAGRKGGGTKKKGQKKAK